MSNGIASAARLIIGPLHRPQNRNAFLTVHNVLRFEPDRIAECNAADIDRTPRRMILVHGRDQPARHQWGE
jgi:hypothetical protein